MPTYTVEPGDLPTSLIDGSKLMFDGVVEAIQTTCGLQAEPIFQRLVSGEHPPPVDRGTSRRQFHVANLSNGAVIYDSAAHFPILEEGRRPGARMPPVKAIYEWVRRKQIGATLVGGAKSVEAQQKSIAYLIARKIAERGLKAHHFFRRLEQELTPQVEAAIERVLGRGPRA